MIATQLIIHDLCLKLQPKINILFVFQHFAKRGRVWMCWSQKKYCCNAGIIIRFEKLNIKSAPDKFQLGTFKLFTKN